MTTPRLLMPCAFLHAAGGFENFVEGLCRTAERAGFDVLVVTPFVIPPNSTVRRAASDRVSFTSAQEQWWRSGSGRLLTLLSRTKARLRGRQPPDRSEQARGRFRATISSYWRGHGAALIGQADLVHLIGRPMPFVQNALAAARAAGRPLMFTEVAQITAEYALRDDQRGFTDLCNDLDLFVGYCAQHVEDARRRFGYRGSAEVHDQWAYGIESELLALEPPDRPTDTPLQIASVSRLSGEKRIEDLLAAVALVRGRAPKNAPALRVDIAGQGPERERLRRVAGDLGLEDLVRWSGYVEDLPSFYGRADCIVIASSREGGPITGVEAMAAARAVVSTPVGANPERLAGGVGLEFPVGDTEQLAQHLETLRDRRELVRSMGEGARRVYLERNARSVRERALVETWHRVLRSRSGAAAQEALEP